MTNLWASRQVVLRYAVLSLALLLCPVYTAAQKLVPVTIYVGPQVREGFVDVDQGVLDSIQDVIKELKKDRSLRVVPGAADATLRLTVLRRRSGAGDGGVLVGAVYVPVQGRAIDAILHAGGYERPLTADDREWGTWSRAAKILANDVRTWIAVNRGKIAP